MSLSREDPRLYLNVAFLETKRKEKNSVLHVRCLAFLNYHSNLHLEDLAIHGGVKYVFCLLKELLMNVEIPYLSRFALDDQFFGDIANLIKCDSISVK